MKPKLVLCEGKDDQAVIEGLLSHLGIETDVGVEQIESRDNLGNYLRALIQRPEFVRREVQSLGIVMDADDNAQANWRRIVDHVRNVFKVTLEREAVPAGDRPRISGTLVPAGGRLGMLEIVCLETVRDARQYGCFEQYVSCLEALAATPLHPKAKFRAWMASQPNYDYLIEKAARRNLLPWENAAFEFIRRFLCDL